MEELFVRYIEGSKYLDRESKSLGELYSEFLAKFTQYHAMVSKTKASGGLLDRMANQLGVTSSVTSSSTATSAFAKLSGMASSMKLSSYPTTVTSPTPAPPPLPNAPTTNGTEARESVTEFDGTLSLDVAEKMLKWHAEAVGRCVEMSPASDV